MFFQEELESMTLSDILELKAVMGAGVFDSLLTVSVKPKRKKNTTVLMFQCEDVRVRTNSLEWLLSWLTWERNESYSYCLQADYVQRDLSRAMSRRTEQPCIRWEPAVKLPSACDILQDLLILPSFKAEIQDLYLQMKEWKTTVMLP